MDRIECRNLRNLIAQHDLDYFFETTNIDQDVFVTQVEWAVSYQGIGGANSKGQYSETTWFRLARTLKGLLVAGGTGSGIDRIYDLEPAITATYRDWIGSPWTWGGYTQPPPSEDDFFEEVLIAWDKILYPVGYDRFDLAADLAQNSTADFPSQLKLSAKSKLASLISFHISRNPEECGYLPVKRLGLFLGADTPESASKAGSRSLQVLAQHKIIEISPSYIAGVKAREFKYTGHEIIKNIRPLGA